MNPVAFTIFGLGIRWYAILITAGIGIGTVLAMLEAKRVGYDPDTIVDLLLWAIPAAVIGARAYYVIFEWDYFKNNLTEIFATRNGGLAIYGAIIGALIVGYLFVRSRKLDFLKICDITAPSLILGQAIGRWGNFINQEAHGGVVSQQFISHFPMFIQKQMFINGQYYQPTFLYESVWDIAVFILLMCFRKHKRQNGEVLALYLIFYSIGRFYIEGLRTDSLMLGPLRISQVVSIVFAVLGLALFIYRRWFAAEKAEV